VNVQAWHDATLAVSRSNVLVGRVQTLEPADPTGGVLVLRAEIVHCAQDDRRSGLGTVSSHGAECAMSRQRAV